MSKQLFLFILSFLALSGSVRGQTFNAVGTPALIPDPGNLNLSVTVLGFGGIVATTKEEFDKMPANKQAHISSNSDMHNIVDASKVSKQRIPHTEIPSMSADKIAHIHANLDKYEILN